MQVLDPEALQTGRGELPKEPLTREVLREGPLIQGEGVEGPTGADKRFIPRTLREEQLTRGVAVDQARYLLGIVLGHQELTGGDIEECRSIAPLLAADRRQPVVGLMVHHLIAICDTRSDHLGDPSFHDGLGGLWILQLITDRDAIPGAATTDQDPT